MSTANETQQYTFQAEIKRLLHLLSHSLYQSREIAFRELISNASDALDKMRYVALTDDDQRDAAGALRINVEGRPSERLLIVRDNGVGMTREELVENLGTIARSGSLEFLKGLSQKPDQADRSADLSLIGQFGVGFYASFMVADTVRVRTRSYQRQEGWEWQSDGSGTFTVTPVEGLERGTEVILHLKDDATELADEGRIREIIRRYSSFVPHPIHVGGEVANDQRPIWVEPRSQVTDEQYTQFYQHLTHHMGESPLWHLHMAADSPIQFRAILYCPPTNFERMGLGRDEHGLSLCARRVLVQNDCRELLPDYLRFLRGLVDSEDLPLNVSRETLQDNTVFRKIRNTLVKGVFDRLDTLAGEQPDAYRAFYDQFGIILKEGIVTDPTSHERLGRLLRFPSSASDDPETLTSFDGYIERAGDAQTHIYYLGGPDLNSIRKSPNLEIFRRRGLEVLFLPEPIDEFVLSALGTYKGKPLTSIDSAELDLPGEPEPEAKPEGTPPTGGMARVLDLFRQALGDRVREVRESKRLTESPCCLVNPEGGPSVQMQRLLKMANKDFPPMGRIFEVNPSAPLIQRLASLATNPDHDAFIQSCGLQLWSNTLLLEGTLPEPEALATRVQQFMEEAAVKRSPIVH